MPVEQPGVWGNNMCNIVPLSDLRRNIHLLLKFGRVAREWTSSTIIFLPTHLLTVICIVSMSLNTFKDKCEQSKFSFFD